MGKGKATLIGEEADPKSRQKTRQENRKEQYSSVGGEWQDEHKLMWIDVISSSMSFHVMSFLHFRNWIPFLQQSMQADHDPQAMHDMEDSTGHAIHFHDCQRVFPPSDKHQTDADN